MIPVYKPSLGPEEKENVIRCLDTKWISSRGEFVERFEKEFCEIQEVNFASAVSNGTVALHVALLALGISSGDEVIVPTLTYIASANAVKYCGATPIFVDSSSRDWQIDPQKIEEKITPKTKAIMVVHLYGHPCDMTEIMRVAKKYKLFVIEDCAESFGSKHQGKFTGTFGDIATFSFFGNKTITTGEGGMVVTNNETLHERVNHLKGQGLSKNRQYWHDIVGYNYRMTNICAAIGVAQIKKAKHFIDRKREIAHQYRDKLSNKFIFHEQVGNNFHTYWMSSILLPKHLSSQRDSFREHLQSAGIETRPVFYPIHTMPMYSAKYESNPVAEDISRRGINLPSYPDLSQEELDYIIDSCLSYEGVV